MTEGLSHSCGGWGSSIDYWQSCLCYWLQTSYVFFPLSWSGCPFMRFTFSRSTECAHIVDNTSVYLCAPLLSSRLCALVSCCSNLPGYLVSFPLLSVLLSNSIQLNLIQFYPAHSSTSSIQSSLSLVVSLSFIPLLLLLLCHILPFFTLSFLWLLCNCPGFRGRN